MISSKAPIINGAKNNSLSAYRSSVNLHQPQLKVKVKGRQTPTKGGNASQINLSRSLEEDPTTVSYNTRVFNKEIMALRNEEEALLKI